jgi:hypothetical protein
LAAADVPVAVVAGAGIVAGAGAGAAATGSALPQPPKSSSAAIVVSAGRVLLFAAAAATGAPQPSSIKPFDLVAAGFAADVNVADGIAALSVVVHTSAEPHGSEEPSGEKLEAAGFADCEAVEERLNGEEMVGDVVD